ncbi:MULTISPECIES: DUF3472 domain-containing protein [Streptomyces]|uniref:DUF3472 domain-containing protein n=1 Tax=Streptomyces TaxID=1883 RepID=UPI0039832A04
MPRGADGEAGVTCGIDDLTYAVGRKYTLTTRKTTGAAGVSYTGTVKDLSTGRVRTIGAWRVPQDHTFRNRANAFIEKYDGIRTCADIPGVKVSYTRAEADGDPLSFPAYTRKATNEPGEDLYTCENVSTYSVTTPAPGSYTVKSRVSAK